MTDATTKSVDLISKWIHGRSISEEKKKTTAVMKICCILILIYNIFFYNLESNLFPVTVLTLSVFLLFPWWK